MLANKTLINIKNNGKVSIPLMLVQIIAFLTEPVHPSEEYGSLHLYSSRECGTDEILSDCLRFYCVENLINILSTS